MIDCLAAVTISILFGAIAFLIRKLTGKGSSQSNRTIICVSLVQAAGYGIAALILQLFSNLNLWTGTVIPLVVLISACAVTTFAVSFSDLLHNDRASRFLKISGYAAFIIILAECLVFNAKSLSGNKDHLIKENIALSGIAGLEEDSEECYSLSEEGVSVHGKTYLLYEDLPGNVRYISVNQVKTGTTDSREYIITVEIKDSSMSDLFMAVGGKRTFGYMGRTDFAVRPSDSGFDLGICVDPADNGSSNVEDPNTESSDGIVPLTVSSVDLWDAAPYEFDSVRVILIWIIVMIAFSITVFGLHRIKYDRNNSWHRIVIELVIFACVAATFMVQGSDKNIVEYPLTKSVDYYDIYIQNFDAFQKGQLNIDYDPPAGLAELNNPYDYSERQKAGIDDFLWDHAYYNGKYYSYFGAAPLFTNYYPVYWVTGRVPTCDAVIAVNGTLAAFFLIMALLTVIRIYCPDARLLLVVACIIAAGSLSYIPILINYGNMYNVACISAIMFIALSLWSGFTATITKGKARYLLYLLSGISLGLCAGSRPSVALCAAVMLPRFISVIVNQKEKVLSRVLQATSFTVPVLVLVAGVMYYNHARFGSPLDFGSAYQLTVGDMHNSGLSASLLPLSFYYYFLIPANNTDLFPYFSFSDNIIYNIESYRYTTMNMGLLNFPYILLAFLLSVPAWLKKRTAEKQHKAIVSALEYRSVILVSALFPVIVAWFVFCMGGACFRYSADIAIPVVILCALVLTQCDPDNKERYALILALAVISVAVMWLLIIYFRGSDTLQGGSNFAMNFPGVIEHLEKAIIFWH